MNDTSLIPELVQNIANASSFALGQVKSIGEAASAINTIREFGKWLFVKSAADEMQNTEGTKPNFDKAGMKILEDLASSGYKKSELIKKFYKDAIKNCLDQRFVSPEIRKEDIDLLDTLDPSDFVIIKTLQDCKTLMLKEWHDSIDFIETSQRMKSYGGALREISLMYPRDYLLKYAKVVFPGIQLTLSDLLYTIKARGVKCKTGILYQTWSISTGSAWVNTDDSKNLKSLMYDEMYATLNVRQELLSNLLQVELSESAVRLGAFISR